MWFTERRNKPYPTLVLLITKAMRNKQYPTPVLLITKAKGNKENKPTAKPLNNTVYK